MKISLIDLENKVIRKARRMSNIELREALWHVRTLNEQPELENPIELRNENRQKELLILEGVYSKELKRRELLEWALRTKP